MDSLNFAYNIIIIIGLVMLLIAVIDDVQQRKYQKTQKSGE